MSLLLNIHDDMPPPPPPPPVDSSGSPRSPSRRTRKRPPGSEASSPASASPPQSPVAEERGEAPEVPKSFFYDPGVAENGSPRAKGEFEQSSSAGSFTSQQFHTRWLGFLFGETMLLALLQLALGVAAWSLALLADLGHSSVDVISYGLNYLMEHLKSKRGHSVALSSRADLCGCGVSTVLLCLATVSASQQAIKRLRATSSPGQGEQEYSSIGHALLGFALVSSAANVGMLLLYRRWCSHGTPMARRAEWQPDAARETVLLRDGIELMVQREEEREVFPEVLRPTVGSTERSERGPGGGGVDIAASGPEAHQPALNLRGAYSGGAGRDGACREECCSSEGTGMRSSWTAQLHMIIHPGCDGSHQQQVGSKDSGTNLNVTAAMLHLAADVLRSITMLVVGVLIESGLVADPGKADAVCALLVAVFVAIGSVALLQRMWAAMRLSF